MLVYDLESFVNFAIRREARTWLASGLVSEQRYNVISTRFPCDFYAPTLFVRVTLLLATLIAMIGAAGLLVLTFRMRAQAGFAIQMIVFGGAAGWLLEQVVVRRKRFFRAGVDDALLYGALGAVVVGVFQLLGAVSVDVPTWAALLVPLPFLAWASIRFTDPLATAAAFVCFMASLFFLMTSLGTPGRSVLPFVFMGVSAAVVFVSDRLPGRGDVYPWEANRIVLESLGLVALYLGGNYFAVRQAHSAVTRVGLPPGEDIPLAWLFWFLTAALPIAFGWWGIRARDRVFIRVALFTLALGLFTVERYLVPGNYALFLTIAGALVLIGAIGVMQYLKEPVHGFTRRRLFRRAQDSLDLEAFLIAASMGKPAEASGGGPAFGGGQSGGAGAERGY